MSPHPNRVRIEEALALAEAPEAAHVFTVRLDEAARGEADAADAARAARSRLPFLGVPVTVKDNIDVAGHATTAGSMVLKDAARARSDAPLLSRLRQSGFILLGRTNMTEFAFSGLGLNPHYGTPANPAIPGGRNIPGGSSSGAAVSVALGIAPVAIGTDTGGSVRIPAAFCGLTGFKPTADSIEQKGVLPLSTTLDSVGVIAGTVAGCTAVFDVIRAVPGAVSPVGSARRMRLGLVQNYVTNGVTDEVAAPFREAIDALEAAGTSVERVGIPELDSIPEMMSEGSFAAAEAHAWHEPLLRAGRGGDYDPRVLTRIEAGGRMSAGAYVRLIERRRAFIAAVADRARGLDALLWPTVPIVAPTFESLATDDAYHAANALVLRNSTVVNLLDGCAISIPCPGARAPVGLTLAAGYGQDDALLGLASAIESIFKGADHGGEQRASRIPPDRHGRQRLAATRGL